MVMASHAITIEKFILKRKNLNPMKITSFHTVNNQPFDDESDETIKTSKQRIQQMFKDAKKKLEPLVLCNNTWSYFCMARLYAVWRKEEKCR
jgi:hypothetical protein